MKKLVSLLLVSCLAISCFAGCSSAPAPTEPPLELPVATESASEPPVEETETVTEPIEEPVIEPVLTSVGAGFEAWQGEWINHIPEDGKSILISPLSLKMACLLAADGAEGDTLTQMLDMFGYSSLDEFMDWGEYVLGIQDELALNAVEENVDIDEEGQFFETWGGTPGSTFKIANGIWHNTNEPGEFNADYKARAARLCAAIEEMPGAELKDAINNWANEATNGLIPEVVGDEVAEMNNILANALYLKAGWINEFGEDFVEEDFTTKNGEIVQKTMMTQQTKFKYYADDTCSFAIMPMYDNFYMLAVKGDATGVSEKIGDASYTLLNLKMPKFEITYSAPNIVDMMKQMGVKDAFNPDLADFTGLMDVPTFISAITQDSKIVVDENGIEAAAVTVIQMATNGFISDPPQPIDFFLDEAFTFYIYHESYLEDDTVARELLFYGEYNQ